MRIKNYLNNIQGVGSGQRATVDIPVNRRIHAVKFFPTATGVTAASDIIENITLQVNGVTQRDTITPTDLQAIATLNGRSELSNTTCTMFFSETWRASIIGEEITSLDVFGASKVSLLVQFKTGLTSPALQVSYEFDYGRNVNEKGQPIVALIRQTPINYNASANVFDITTIPIDYPIQRVHFIPSTGSIDKLEIYRDSELVFESTKIQNNQMLKPYLIDGTAFGSGSFSFIADYEQQVSSPLIANNSLTFRLFPSAANNLRALVEQRVNSL